MDRRNFLMTSALTGTAVSGVSHAVAEPAAGSEMMPKLSPPEEPAELNLCLQWNKIPGGAMNEKLDFLEENGFAAVEIPSGNWPIENCDDLLKAISGVLMMTLLVNLLYLEHVNPWYVDLARGLAIFAATILDSRKRRA